MLVYKVEVPEGVNNFFLYKYIGNCSQVSIANAEVLVGNEGHLVIRCNEGYTLIGSNAMSCLPNGLLNATLPSCGRGTLLSMLVIFVCMVKNATSIKN